MDKKYKNILFDMEEKVYDLLKKLNIEYEVVQHQALFTCADNDKYGISFDGTICKNLFIFCSAFINISLVFT